MKPFVWALGLIVASVTVPVMISAARADDCGGAVPCSCGGRVVESRTLSPADPVTLGACPAGGLEIETDGVVLNLGGRTIRGLGIRAGILVAANNVTVTSGIVQGFAFGILGTGTVLGPATGNVLSNLQVIANSLGIQIGGWHRLTLQKTVVRFSTIGDGIGISGDDIVVQSSRAEDNAGSGLGIFGRNNSVLHNVVLRNGSGGVSIGGDAASVTVNQSRYNGREGFRVGGTNHSVTRNQAIDNDADGFTVTATESHFDRNVSNYNNGFGILDSTSGNGTEGTANTYTNNLCNGTALGDSSPAGLCF